MVGYLYDDTLEDFLLERLMATAHQADIPFCAISIPSIKQMLAGHEAEVLIPREKAAIKGIASLPPIVDCTFPVHAKPALEKYGAEFLTELCEKTHVCSQKTVEKRHFPAFLYHANLFEYAIPTYEVHNFDEFQKAAAFFPDAVLKPSNGRMGSRIYHLQRKENNNIYIEIDGKAELFTEAFFNRYLSEIKKTIMGHALLQPYMDFKLDDGHALEFKLLRHRDETGEWKDVGTYAMIGKSTVVANISKGGTFGNVRECLCLVAKEKADAVYEAVMELGIKVAKEIEKLYGSNAYCLGIDIAVERNSLQPYVVEANTYPNAKRFIPQIAEKRLSYYKYLQNYFGRK